MTAPGPGNRTGAAVDALRERAVSAGEPFRGGANRAIALDDPDAVWFVESGWLDVFAVECREADVALGESRLKHMFRAGTGDIAFPFVPAGEALRFVAKGSADARLRRVPLVAFLDAVDDEPRRGAHAHHAASADRPAHRSAWRG